MLHLFFPKMHTQLGRWCHVTAPAYAKTCNWESKVDLANYDNSIGTRRPPAPRQGSPTDDDARVKLYLLSSFYPLP